MINMCDSSNHNYLIYKTGKIMYNYECGKQDKKKKIIRMAEFKKISIDVLSKI